MSKIKALITALVLGSSSAAMASPSVSFHAEASWGTGSPVVIQPPAARDHRVGTTAWYGVSRRPVRMTWISLAEPMHLYRGRDTIRLEQAAMFNQIRIQSTAGASYISLVTVRFTDGTRQQFALNKWISARSPMLQFNLNTTKRIDRILINGSTEGTASYQVFGYGTSLTETPPVYHPPVQPPVYQPPVYQPPVYEPRTVPLSGNLTFSWSNGNREILVGQGMGRFTSLRITGVTGASIIGHMMIQFTNGHEQMVTIGKTLKGGELVDIPLDAAGRNSVQRVTVYQNSSTDRIGGAEGEFKLSGF